MITVNDFKAHFSRDFPYLPEMVEGKAYFTGDIVYVEPNFYESLIDANLQPVTDETAWTLYNDNTDSYLADSDVEKSIAEATLGFNEALFDDNSTDTYMGDRNLALLYLTAFYLVLDIKNSTAGLSSNAYQSFVSSKSVGNVSESYGTPAWVANNPMYSIYLDNGYGLKYLSFVIPAVTGWLHLSKGGTTAE